MSANFPARSTILHMGKRSYCTGSEQKHECNNTVPTRSMQPKSSPSECKRRRQDTDIDKSSSDTAQPARDDSFWYEDGDVVLVTNEVAFCVYKGLLAKRSEALRDMFNSAKPTVGGPFDGCLVVQLGDSPFEIRHLLDALLRSSRLFEPNVNLSSEQLVAMVLLGRKYGIQDIYDAAISRFKVMFPSTYEAWIAVCTDFKHIFADAIFAVKIARLTDTLSILPCAFYICSRHDGIGWRMYDGSIRLHSTHPFLVGARRSDGSLEKLSAEDQTLCVEGYAASRAAAAIVITSIFSAVGINRHVGGDGCKTSIQAMCRDQLEVNATAQYCVFTPWDAYIRSKANKWPLYASCIQVLK
ncbi:hypothetical protein WOLCODRAFT_145110, partial [Wolfiporia cocos MD-104 SS10]